MRVKRSGQAAKIRRRRWGIMALVLAGLALCLLAALPVQAARNTQKHCFPLDTTAWRVSGRLRRADRPLYRQVCVPSGT